MLPICGNNNPPNKIAVQKKQVSKFKFGSSPSFVGEGFLRATVRSSKKSVSFWACKGYTPEN